MSSSPPSDAGPTAAGDYQSAWSAIIDLIKRGDSWSGHERNCVFLNGGASSPRFANASAASGLDFPDDARSVAATDWDHDGDLDLWFRNRTAPRLRLMLNQSERASGANRSVALRLEGTRSNRDGIGARVTVRLPNQPPLMRTVHAGDAFLSQSSTTLHFGLGAAERLEAVTVRWPGERTEAFRGLEPGGRYLLREGDGEARPLPPRDGRPKLAARPQVTLPETARAAVLLPRRVPLPPLSYRSSLHTEASVSIENGPRPLLLLFWASWCPACREELRELASHRDDLEAAGLDLLALSVDHLGASPAPAGKSAAVILEEAGFSSPRGFATSELLDTLRGLEEVLFDRHSPFAVPAGFLLSPDRELVAIYRGRLPLEVLRHDARCATSTDEELRDHALPFPGRWYTRPYSRPQMFEHFADLTARTAPEASLHYLERAAAEATSAGQRAELARTLAVRHYQHGHRLMSEPKNWDTSIHHFNRAIDHDPGFAEAYHARGALEGNRGELAAARLSLERALALKPGDAEIQRKLAILSRAEEEQAPSRAK